MSNVLIGIIGVILFIGLALAGALILGNDFLTASNSARGARYVAQTSQIARAASMYEIKLGRPVTTQSNLTFLVPRFLKAVPDGGYQIARWDARNAASYILLPETQESRNMCEEIQRQTRMIGDSDAFWTVRGTIENGSSLYQSGCRLYSAGTQIAIWTRI